MKLNWLFILVVACTSEVAFAEGGCPPGQYPIGGQGAVACAPIPTESAQPKAHPIGKWIKTWGAIASGSVDSIVNYGVSTGKISKAEAEEYALAECSSHGEQNCKVNLTYRNQCAAVATPQINGKPAAGTVNFIGRENMPMATSDALAACKKDNPKAQCDIIYKNCTEQIFQKF
ncbi:DUF4189 domain-containing protein [Xanthomonas campestris]|uniref:DUF4189 domain-containing protein n=1 Tax=Xanthomonas campestris TaxID=339 RepID=UPI0005AF027C|nr:DUF4189 domain-containing protein [Xanthomonas campestris]KIQ23071.1 hypothetical protein RT95_20195 [Xanthomonas campestris]